MRVLAWPLYTYPGNPLADSGYICMRNLIRAVPEWNWLMVVPEWAVNGKALTDDLDDLPNVTKIPVPMEQAFRPQEAVLDPAMVWKFSPQQGSQHIDACIAGSNQIAATLMNAWRPRQRPEDRPLVVSWDLLTRDDGSAWQSDEVELMMHFVGAAVVDLNVFGSPMMEAMTMKMLRKQFAPYVVRDVMVNKSETVFAGVPVERLDSLTKNVKKRDKFTMFYGGRLGKVKRVDDLTEVANLAFQFGRDMSMVVATGSISKGKKEKFAEEFPFVELHVGTKQEEAWELMAECHAAIMWSRHEMIGSMFVEEMAYGLPVIATPHKWLTSLLPEEYPFWADSKAVAGAKVRSLYDRWVADPDGYDSEMRPWKQYVRERYDSVDAGQAFRGLVEARHAPLKQKALDDYADGQRAALLELAEQVLTEGMTFDEYLDGLRGLATVGKMFVGRRFESARSNSIPDAYRAAQYLGWTDVGTETTIWSKQ